MTAVYLLSIVVFWLVAVACNRIAVRRRDGQGDPQAGIVFFVEPVRWLFVIWGFRHFCDGLRRGGYRGQIRLFRWSTSLGALLVVPDVIRQDRLIRRAARLAERIERVAQRHPDAAIHLCGYSSGGYIALEAVRRLERARVRTVLLLAATLSPDYPLETLDGCAGRIIHVYSPLDLINLLGPLLIGTNDRRWTPACGSIGFETPARHVRQYRWRADDVRHGYLGDHFTIVSPRFVAAHLAPWVREAAGGDAGCITGEGEMTDDEIRMTNQ